MQSPSTTVSSLGQPKKLTFQETLEDLNLPLRRRSLKTLQVNIGKLCDLACRHCHVEAGPNRTENMTQKTVDAILGSLDQAKEDGLIVETVDITGGAPELNPNFRNFVEKLVQRNLHVINRSNLTSFFEPGQKDTPSFLAAHGVEIIASLPCYTLENVEAQRGRGVFAKSIKALKMLNSLGYGIPGNPLKLNLVFNPLGSSLPPDQTQLEAEYKIRLQKDFGIQFHHLFTITNMPIKRFAHDLDKQGQKEAYMDLLVSSFNPEAAHNVMCFELVSVAYDGTLYDCDFNQMLDIPLGHTKNQLTIFDTPLAQLVDSSIATKSHCFGCTAGAGSSCGGTLTPAPPKQNVAQK